MPFDPACAGKTYPPETVRVRWDAVEQFVRRHGEDNPSYVDPRRRGGIVAPPLYAARLALPALRAALGDAALGVPASELILAGCEFQFDRPVRPGRDVVISASFGAIERERRGEMITLRLQGTRRLGVLVFVAELRLLHPDAPDAPDPDAPPRPATHFLRPPLAFRAHYKAPGPPAEGPRGDPPLAVDHVLGPCLALGRAARTVIDTSLKRDPAQLKRIGARPVRPLEPGEPLTVAGWIIETRGGTTFMGFEMLDEAGGLVMADGVAEVVLR